MPQNRGQGPYASLVYVYKRGKGKRGIHLLSENAPTHRSAVVFDYLKEQNLDILPHPPFITDLAPDLM